MKKVVIAGGGFAGVEAAIFLKKHGFDVTLVSNRDYLYLYPISIWIPTGALKAEKAMVSLEELSRIHKFTLIINEVTRIEAKKRTVHLRGASVGYDYLVVAIGSHKLKPRGREHFLSICGDPEEALAIKAKIDSLLEKKGGKIAVGFAGNPHDVSAVRGGPAFEVLFNIHHLLKRKGLLKNFEITFFAPMNEPGARMGKKAVKMMDVYLDKLGIKKHYGKKIKEFTADGIVFEDNSKLESDFTMFIPAGDGHAVIKESDLHLNEAGFVRINDYCQAEGFPEVFAIGDVAEITGPDWRAKQGHIAELMARTAAFNIAAIERGSVERQGYRGHLNILCVMDSGDGANFVYRDAKREFIIPLPIIGHWLKKAWGIYYSLSKRKKIFRLPGL
ncbi:MAG TPA: FAD-dependent oxidoreductase [Spirochaetota bacterium]|nr:FAD-dependent oxidoreductase [Spirochaetota bacterium]